MEEPKQYEFITDEIVKKGVVTIYSTEEDMRKLKEINTYNEYMKLCRTKMMELKQLREMYLLINVIIIATLIFTLVFNLLLTSTVSLIKPLLCVIFLIIYVVVYMVFSFFRGELDLMSNILAAVPLLFVDWLFVILLVFDLAFCLFYRYKKGSLGEEIGYPLFYDIRIDRIRNRNYVVEATTTMYSDIVKRTLE